MKSKVKIPVSARAAEQRINRVLAKVGESLRRSRSANMFSTLGAYCIVDVQKKCITEHHIDLEDKANEVGAMREWEHLES